MPNSGQWSFDDVIRGLVLFVVALIVCVGFNWFVAWQFERQRIDEHERHHADCFAQMFINTKVLGFQEDHIAWMKCTENDKKFLQADTDVTAKISAAAQRAFFYPWPWIGLLLEAVLVSPIFAPGKRTGGSHG